MSKHSQQAALQHYLDSLLDTVAVSATATAEPIAAQPLLAELERAPVVSALAFSESLISEEELARLPVSQLVAEQEPVETQAQALKQVSWSDTPFECLLFDVAGLTLAVPLAALGSIYSFKADDLTPLFAQPDWFIGILPTNKGHLKVLETARWVMPERYTADMRDDLKYVISINGFDWGLAVHQLRDSIQLEPNQVKWRSQRGQRAWLAGTVIEHMCALLDVEVLATLMNQPAAAQSVVGS